MRHEPVNSLPLVTVGGEGAPAEVELRESLGEGGMGIVWSALQTSLRREVAVKGLRPNLDESQGVPHLLREARVTGALEHPNVVPIHALGRDQRGRPLIVMKRIEGRSWDSLLASAQRDEGGGLPVELQMHLEILVLVAKAAHFAHSKGIVHRDLKPANVLLGTFGEVYVSDWGIAVNVEDDALPDIPDARSVDAVAGTPEYMAPEQAVADGPNIDQRTDVYLLGAVLHEIITGSAPHEARTMLLSLTSAFASAPQTYAPTVPPDLLSIVQCAMARDPEERFQSAHAFATALEGFVRHQNSTLLSDEAQDRFEQLRAAIAAADPLQDDFDEHELYDLFGESRFGFTHALRIWEHNQVAKQGLQDALELMIEFELDHESPGASAALVAQLPQPRPQLAKRVEEARKKAHRAEYELKRLTREADPTVADRLRSALALGTGLFGGSLLLLLGWASRRGWYDAAHLELAALNGMFLFTALCAAFFARRQLFVNAANLRAQLTVLLIYAAFTAMWPLCDTLGIGLMPACALQLLLGTFLWMVGAAVVDRRMVSMASSMLVGLVGVLLLRAYYFEWLGSSLLIGSSLLAWLRLRTKSAAEARPLSQRWSQKAVDRELRGAISRLYSR